MTYPNFTKAMDLKFGDAVDLENDPYADEDHTHVEYEFEYAMVTGVDPYSEHVEITFDDNDVVLFPPDHELYVDHNEEGLA